MKYLYLHGLGQSAELAVPFYAAVDVSANGLWKIGFYKPVQHDGGA